MGSLLVGALNGVSKAEILNDGYAIVPGYWDNHLLHSEVGEIARGSFKRREPPQISGSGYVVRTLEAALWALDRTSSFQEGLIKVVSLGGDTDTTGAVYGQIAGAIYGVTPFPRSGSQSSR